MEKSTQGDSDEALAPDFRDEKLLDMLVTQSAVLSAAANAEMDDGQERFCFGLACKGRKGSSA